MIKFQERLNNLKWFKPVEDACWWDGTELIGMIEMSSGKIEIHTFNIKCDGDWLVLENENGETFDCWGLSDFNYVAVLNTVGTYGMVAPNNPNH